MEIASNMLLQILATWPVPSAPQWTTFFPIFSKIGFAVSNALLSPPTINVSVAASAPTVPPETGASSMTIFFCAAEAATSRAVCGSMVLQSISKVPGFTLASNCPVPAYTSRTWGEEGSIVMTTSAFFTVSATDVAAVAPVATTLATASGNTSNTASACPALTRLRAIGPPILPNPMNPIFISFLLALSDQFEGWSLRGALFATKQSRIS